LLVDNIFGGFPINYKPTGILKPSRRILSDGFVGSQRLSKAFGAFIDLAIVPFPVSNSLKRCLQVHLEVNYHIRSRQEVVVMVYP
jgi:hypothetical protein